MCMARAIVVSKAFVDNDPQYQTIRDSCKKRGKKLAESEKMCRQYVQKLYVKQLVLIIEKSVA